MAGVPEAVAGSVFDLADEFAIVSPGASPSPNGNGTEHLLRNMSPPRQYCNKTIIVSLLLLLIIVHDGLVSASRGMDVHSPNLSRLHNDGVGGKVELLVPHEGGGVGFFV